MVKAETRLCTNCRIPRYILITHEDPVHYTLNIDFGVDGPSSSVELENKLLEVITVFAFRDDGLKIPMIMPELGLYGGQCDCCSLANPVAGDFLSAARDFL